MRLPDRTLALRAVQGTGLVLALAAAPGVASAQSWEDLEAARAVVTSIDIVVADVFDLTNASDDNWFGHAANAIHVQTRQRVVRSELLFETGEVVDAARIHETERNLRRYSFIRDAHIYPDGVSNGGVRARVEVLDAWSLTAGVDINRSGGATRWSVSADEKNFVGAGKGVSVTHERNRERSANEIAYVDPQVFSSQWQMSLRYADLTDGRTHLVLAQRPYRSVETRYALGGFANAADYTLTQYHLGEAAFTIPTQTRSAAVFASHAFAAGTRTAVRLGATYRAREFVYGDVGVIRPSPLPVPDTSTRRWRGLGATWAVVQDRSRTFQNFASIGRTEDFNLGWVASGASGYYARAFGSVESAPFTEAGVSRAWRIVPQGLLLIDAGVSGRYEERLARDATIRGGLTAYSRAFPGQTLAVRFDAVAVTRPDPETWLYLDSTAGMRGYVDHFLAGDRRVVLSMDDRIITTRQLLGVLQMGFVLYGDVGAIRRFDTGRWSRTYANIGGGLRFGSLKGARNNVLHVSVAVPVTRDSGVKRALLVLGNELKF